MCPQIAYPNWSKVLPFCLCLFQPFLHLSNPWVILFSLRNPGLRLFQFEQDTGRCWKDQNQFFNDFWSWPITGFWTLSNSSWTWPKQTRRERLIGSWSMTSLATMVWQFTVDYNRLLTFAILTSSATIASKPFRTIICHTQDTKKCSKLSPSR